MGEKKLSEELMDYVERPFVIESATVATAAECRIWGSRAATLEAALAASEQGRELAEDALHRACREVDARDTRYQQASDADGRDARAEKWARFFTDKAAIARRAEKLLTPAPAPTDAAGLAHGEIAASRIIDELCGATHRNDATDAAQSDLAQSTGIVE